MSKVAYQRFLTPLIFHPARGIFYCARPRVALHRHSPLVCSRRDSAVRVGPDRGTDPGGGHGRRGLVRPRPSGCLHDSHHALGVCRPVRGRTQNLRHRRGARHRLVGGDGPRTLLRRLTYQVGTELDDQAPAEWRWLNRRVRLVDATMVKWGSPPEMASPADLEQIETHPPSIQYHMHGSSTVV